MGEEVQRCSDEREEIEKDRVGLAEREMERIQQRHL